MIDGFITEEKGHSDVSCSSSWWRKSLQVITLVIVFSAEGACSNQILSLLKLSVLWKSMWTVPCEIPSIVMAILVDHWFKINTVLMWATMWSIIYSLARASWWCMQSSKSCHTSIWWLFHGWFLFRMCL